MTYKEIARAIASAYDPPTEGNSNAPPFFVRYYRADGTATVNKEEARYMTRYNPLTKRLRVLLYPHHETVGSFYLDD